MYPNYNDIYQYRGYNQPQTIQNVSQQIQSQASCYFVKAPEELAGLNIMPNVFYLGINRDKKEIYVRRMNNDGNIETETYALFSGVEEKNDIKTILDRLNVIERRLGDGSDSNVNKQLFNGEASKSSSHATI